MQYPIIEIRENNLFVLDDFEGDVVGAEIKRPFNFQRNLNRYVIDSRGEVWEFIHKDHNHRGFRKMVSVLWNISSDIYSYEKLFDKDAGWLRSVLKEYLSTENPDTNELAKALTDDLSDLEDNLELSTVMSKLNL